MKLLLPKNIYSKMLASVISDHENLDIVFKESSLITNELENNHDAVGLIPSVDLINHRSFFVSSKIGISFDGALSNAYFYLSQKDERALGKILLRGDVSLNEIILTKILFSEKFSSDIEVSLDIKSDPQTDQNVLVVGDENFAKWEFENGISFADQIADIIDLPYVNFILSSYNKNMLTEVENMFANVDDKINDNLERTLTELKYGMSTKLLIKENIGAVYFEITENEIDALMELYKLIYYHGIIEDMFDLNMTDSAKV